MDSSFSAARDTDDSHVMPSRSHRPDRGQADHFECQREPESAEGPRRCVRVRKHKPRDDRAVRQSVRSRIMPKTQWILALAVIIAVNVAATKEEISARLAQRNPQLRELKDRGVV